MFENLKKIFQAFSIQERRVFAVTFVSAVVSSLLLSGVWVANATRVVPAAGGDFIEGIVGQPTYINPVIAVSETDKGLVRMVFSSLTSLAEKTESSKDGRTWKIRLREKLLWQNGEKLTSDDVLFTVQRIQDPDVQSPLFSAWQGVLATRLSELELQFVLANPYAFFSYNLENLFIVPKHLLDDVAPANWRLSEYNLKPVGSGPYAFDSYKTRPDGFIETYRLKRNPHYAEDRPFIDEIHVEFFSESDSLVQAFNAGKIDGVGGLGLEDIQGVTRPHLELSFRLPRYYAVFLNQSKNLALKESEVRRALAFATDGQKLVEEVLGGKGVAVRGPIPPDALYASQALEPSEFSKDAAREILEQAGWKETDAGERAKTIRNTTIPLELTVVVPQISFLTRTADILRSLWEEVGIKVNVVARAPEEVSNSIIKNRDYEALIFGNILSPSSDLFSFWHSSERFHPGLNLALYNNKTVDSLIEASRQNLDSVGRADAFFELQQAIMEDHPAVFLYSPHYLYLIPKGVGGIESGVLGEAADRFRSIGTWYLNTARVLK
ncbi:peptide ABC transporter substrate-binding protein [Candidatus Parcubacteria bacterium]|nr:MAG: peptide ABC transporter substrate-binding protein [Candidatus Parcubacteria bacterium]